MNSRLAGIARLVGVLLGVWVVAIAGAPVATAAQCGLSDQTPLWIEYSDSGVAWWKEVFARPGLVIATGGAGQAAALREAGAKTVFFDLHLTNRVGDTTFPADPATIVAKADRLFDYAVGVSGCSTPLIAENELFGAGTVAPWSTTNAQYRANVLGFLQELAARGAHPYILLSTEPYTGGPAADWWRRVAQVADIVQEVYFPGPGFYAVYMPGVLARIRAVERGDYPFDYGRYTAVYRRAALLGSRALRVAMRQSVANFTAIGIPARRVGLMMEFETGLGQGGRNGLQPSSAWFQLLKLEALAARQVGSELGIGTIWSWGWATYTRAGADPDKSTAACVYLWARDTSLCNAPPLAGPTFDTSRTEGQILLEPGVTCRLPAGSVRSPELAQTAAAVGSPDLAASALLGRLVSVARMRASPDEVSAVERALVRTRFGGDRQAYLAQLRAAHVTQSVARSVIADQIRRARIDGSTRVWPASPAEIGDFYARHGMMRSRLVEVTPAAWWLGGRTRGLAIASIAPAIVFQLPTGKPLTIVTADGPLVVRALGVSVPLAVVRLATASPAVSAGLARSTQDAAYRSWVARRAAGELTQAVCLRDELPQPQLVDLSDSLPFLALR